jgi:small subunit ribosomal protein S16
MALKIRMARGGRTHRPHYSIVVADSRSPRDGRYVEKVGSYDPLLPHENENRIRLVTERIEYWLGQGAKPSDRVARFLGKAGLISMPEIRETPKKSAPGEKAQERIREKEEKLQAAKEAEEAAKAEKEAEAAAAAEAPAAEETPVEETPAEEASAEEAPAEEAPAEEPAAAAEEEKKEDG